jgi:hypothetical protein
MFKEYNAIDRFLVFATFGVCLGALIVITFPVLIIFGLFLLVIPGVILGLLPLVALYTCIFTLAWIILRSAGVRMLISGFIGICLCLAVGFGVPIQNRNNTKFAFAEVMSGDKIPAQPLKIKGAVSIKVERLYGEKAESCDALCLRLLYNGTAQSVVMFSDGKPVGHWTIEQRKKCPIVKFRNVDNSWGNWPVEDAVDNAKNFTPRPHLLERVNARMAVGECLIYLSETAEQIDWEIALTRLKSSSKSDAGAFSLTASEPRGQRLSIFERQFSGEMREVARTTNASASPISRFLMPLPSGAWGQELSWYRDHIGSTDYGNWDSVKALRRLAVFNPALPVGMSSHTMRRLLSDALSDPERQINDPGLLLANAISADIARNGAMQGDALLLSKAIKDERFVALDFPYQLRAKLGDEFELLAMAAIYRAKTVPMPLPRDGNDWRDFVRSDLDSLIAAMPDEWYAAPPKEFISLLGEPTRAALLENTINKLSAGGDSSIPLLIDIIDRSADAFSVPEANGDSYKIRKELESRGVTDFTNGVSAAVAALCKIGPQARIALPTIDRAHAEIMGNGSPQDNYIVTQVFFGRPLDRFTPPNNPTTINGSWQNYIWNKVGRGECGF